MNVMIPIFLFVAALLRILRLDLMEYKADQVQSFYTVIQFLEHPYIMTHGIISSLGTSNFPLFHYVLSFFALYAQNPLEVTLRIALINSLLIPVFYMLMRRYYGTAVALLASLFLALSPWMIEFSRVIWAQDFLMIFLVPFFYFIHALVIGRKKSATIPVIVLLLLLIQIHGSGIYLALATITVLIIYRAPVSKRLVGTGLILGLIPALPYIFHQMLSVPLCPDCRAFIAFRPEFDAADFLPNIIRPFQIMNGLSYEFLLGPDASIFQKYYPVVRVFTLLFILESVFLIKGMIVCWKNPKYRLLVIYTLSVPLLYLVTVTPAYVHYYVIIAPAIALLYAIGITSYFSNMKKSFARSVFLATVAILFISRIIFVVLFASFLDQQKIIAGDYGMIYRQKKIIVEQTVKKYKLSPYYISLEELGYLTDTEHNMHANFGLLFLKNNEFRLASEELSQFVRANEPNERFRKLLIYSFIQSGKLKEAEAEWNNLADRTSPDAKELQKLLFGVESREKNN